jgi:hypothetical protein
MARTYHGPRSGKTVVAGLNRVAGNGAAGFLANSSKDICAACCTNWFLPQVKRGPEQISVRRDCVRVLMVFELPSALATPDRPQICTAAISLVCNAMSLEPSCFENIAAYEHQNNEHGSSECCTNQTPPFSSNFVHDDSVTPYIAVGGDTICAVSSQARRNNPRSVVRRAPHRPAGHPSCPRRRARCIRRQTCPASRARFFLR